MNKLKIGLLTLGLMIAGVASATVIDCYVAANSTTTVSQAITWDDAVGNGISDRHYVLEANAIAGSTYTASPGMIKNHANNGVPIEFVTDITNITDSTDNECAGITVKYQLDGSGLGYMSDGTEYIVPSEGKYVFNIIVDFASDLASNTYTIETSVNPAI